MNSAAPTVNYDGPALVEVEIDGTEYRIDAGKHGTALCISTRPAGTWTWSYRAEARWDAHTLRAKALERRLLDRLTPALVDALAQISS